MKCVKNIATGAVTRVSNAIAERLVAIGTHKYASKVEWKQGGRQR